jgi:hypothetical protein
MKPRILTAIALCGALLWGQNGKLREIKPGMNFFKKEQDVQMGREYAQQIEQQVDVIQRGPLTDYIHMLGQKIVEQKEAGGFPYVFKVVNDPTINAFALPGGPVYIHTGILLNAENEGQLMGVIAHEVAHIALRHSTNQVSKSYLIQLPAMLAGMYGQQRGGITGMLAQLGVGLGANGVLMKFSRSAEQQADLLGARMMANAGYNPIEMARFFETLEAQAGGKSGPSFFSSHPNPGNRVKYVSEEITLLPRRDYNANSGRFPQMKALAKALPAPKRRMGQEPSAANQPAQNQDGTRTWKGEKFTINYPGAWTGFGEAGAQSVTLAPKEGLVQDDKGRVQIGLGVVVAEFDEINPRASFRDNTLSLIQQIQQQNPSMSRNQPQLNQHQVNGRDVLVARLTSKSPLDNGNEIDTLVTMEHKGELIYLVFIAPERQMQNVQRDFDAILSSLKLL